jgi:hypothetical protein
MDYLTIVSYVGKTAAAIVSILTMITLIRPYVMEWLADKGKVSLKIMPKSLFELKGLEQAEAVRDYFKKTHKLDWRPKVLKKKRELQNRVNELKKAKLNKKETREVIISTEIPKQKFQPVQELELSKEEVESRFTKVKTELLSAIDHQVPTGFTKFDHKWTVIKSELEPLEASHDYLDLMEKRMVKFKKELKEALARA